MAPHGPLWPRPYWAPSELAKLKLRLVAGLALVLPEFVAVMVTITNFLPSAGGVLDGSAALSVAAASLMVGAKATFQPAIGTAMPVGAAPAGSAATDGDADGALVAWPPDPQAARPAAVRRRRQLRRRVGS